jgi:hypothetical protein
LLHAFQLRLQRCFPRLQPFHLDPDLGARDACLNGVDDAADLPQDPRQLAPGRRLPFALLHAEPVLLLAEALTELPERGIREHQLLHRVQYSAFELLPG